MGTGVSPKRIGTRSDLVIGSSVSFVNRTTFLTKLSHRLRLGFIKCSRIDNSTVKHIWLSTSSSLERRWSSRTFRYGYLVTTSPQSSVPPSAAPPKRLPQQDFFVLYLSMSSIAASFTPHIARAMLVVHSLHWSTYPASKTSNPIPVTARLGHWLRALPTPMVWRAVCTRPGNVFTATFWFAITCDSCLM